MKVETIELDKSPNLFNNSLIHWTGKNNKDNPEASINILTRIIKTSSLLFGRHLLLPPIKNQTKNYTEESSFSGLMICFTDMPVEKSYIHCEKYGYVGIGFKKEDLIKYGANPVFYFTDEQSNIINLYQEKSRLDEIDISLSWMNSIIQHYNSGENEYFEREWRISRAIPLRNYELSEKYKNFLKTENNRLYGKTYSILDTTNDEKDKYYLRFERKHIDCLIAPVSFENELKTLVNQYDDLDCKLILIKNNTP